MAVAITATLSEASAPAPVIIQVTGAPAGSWYRVWGTTDDGFTWDVNGARGVTSDGGQFVVGDILAPTNRPVTYRAGSTALGIVAAPPIIVEAPEFVLQSLDGRTVVSVLAVTDGAFERELAPRTALFNVPGRSRPVSRYDLVQDGTGSLSLATTKAQTAALIDLLRDGAPVVYRQVGIRDLPPVEVVQFTAIKSTSPIGEYREWDLTYQLVDHPEPGVAAVVASWDVFDQVHAASTWTAFDAQWASGTWDGFDAFDWAGML